MPADFAEPTLHRAHHQAGTSINHTIREATVNTKVFGRKSSGLLLAVFSVAGLTLLLSFGCDRETTGPQTTSNLTAAAITGAPEELSLEIVSHTQCLVPGSSDEDPYVPPTQTAVVWEYDGDGNLDLRRINAGLNCCPDLAFVVNLTDRVITVVEQDLGICDCLCLINVDYRISGIKPGKYLLRFDEYAYIGDDQPLECEIVLKGVGSSGMCSAERTLAPWGTYSSATGVLTDYSLVQSCCDMGYTTCFTWDYDGEPTA